MNNSFKEFSVIAKILNCSLEDSIDNFKAINKNILEIHGELIKINNKNPKNKNFSQEREEINNILNKLSKKIENIYKSTTDWELDYE